MPFRPHSLAVQRLAWCVSPRIRTYRFLRVCFPRRRCAPPMCVPAELAFAVSPGPGGGNGERIKEKSGRPLPWPGSDCTLVPPQLPLLLAATEPPVPQRPISKMGPQCLPCPCAKDSMGEHKWRHPYNVRTAVQCVFTIIMATFCRRGYISL